MIDRRLLLQMMGGLSLAGVLPSGARAMDLADADDFLTALAKVRGSTDGRLSIGWVRGTRYAVIDHRAEPMWNLIAATFSRYRKVRPDAYEIRSLEVAYFTDLETGKLLERWYNPWTDRTVDVPMTRMGPTTIIMTTNGLEVPAPSGEAAGMKLDHEFKPAVENGDDVWITENIQVDSRATNPDMPAFVYNEMTTYHASRADLANPELAEVPALVQFHGLVSYRPWMGFGDMDGHTTSHGGGRRAASIDELPRDYVTLTRRHHPDVLADPLAALADVADD